MIGMHGTIPRESMNGTAKPDAEPNSIGRLATFDICRQSVRNIDTVQRPFGHNVDAVAEAELSDHGSRSMDIHNRTYV